MAPLAKDSVLIELLAAEDGYFIRVWKWDQSPPPIQKSLSTLDDTIPEPVFRSDRVSTTKAELKTEFGSFVDSVFDQP